jgi:membrane associated rhomboid family serine protease
MLIAIAAVLLVCHAAVSFIDPDGSRIVERYALTSDSLREGRWITLVTFNFLHGSWLHVGLNSAFALAFGAAPARLFGRDLRGGLTFVAFFLTCGVLSGLGYALLPHSGPWAAVGASGAVSGLTGATARMLTPGGRLGPPWGRNFIGMTLTWTVMNVILGLTPVGTMYSEGLPIAWEAHLVGYAVGAALVGLFWRLSGRREPITQ